VSITPADIEAKTFPLAIRGYRVEAVDAFLDRLQAELGGVPTPAGTAPAADPPPVRHPDAEPEPAPGARALRTLVHAEQMAEQVVAEANAEADEIRARAHAEAQDVIAAARVESGRVESELQARRQRELGALMMQAQQLQAETDRLSTLERTYREALQGLLSQQQQLLDQRLPVLEFAAEASGATLDLRAAS
jgi:DivIVA domain-containing protein